jgi:hypothetical protein
MLISYVIVILTCRSSASLVCQYPFICRHLCSAASRFLNVRYTIPESVVIILFIFLFVSFLDTRQRSFGCSSDHHFFFLSRKGFGV